MNCKQDRPVLASKPSYASTTSAASATSVGSSRSGGSKLLFGEIDTSSERSTESYASVCSLVLCDSSTFLKFWLADECRERFLKHVPRADLKSLRLVCHDFSVRAAPALFNDLSISFNSSTFTRPARLAALDRVGFHVKKLRFNLPHSPNTFLPPLVDPDTGAELNYTYTPQIQSPTLRQPKYGDWGTTEILTRQYPPLFHAATNVPAFIRAFSSFVNLSHLHVSCPDYDATQRHRRSIVDFALISIRIAVERSHLNSLDSLTLSPIHPSSLLYLSPTLGYGADPRSMRRWSRIRSLTIHADTLPNNDGESDAPAHFKLLQSYIRNFERNLTHFNFRWIGEKGIIPIKQPKLPESCHAEHPALAQRPLNATRPSTARKGPRPAHFPRITRFEVENVSASSVDISSFVATHKRTLEELNLEDVELTSGTWDDALAPLAKHAARTRPSTDIAEIPIMLSPTTGMPCPSPMERIGVAQQLDASGGRGTLRMSRFLSSMGKKERKVREGIFGGVGGGGGGDGHLKKVLRGSRLPWR